MLAIRRFLSLRIPNLLPLCILWVLATAYQSLFQFIRVVEITFQRHLGSADGVLPGQPRWHLVLSEMPVASEAAPHIVLIAAVLWTFLPHRRARSLERQYCLTPLGTSERMQLVQDVVAAASDEIGADRPRIYKNEADAGLFCFVYPDGFRRSKLAIGGGFIKLFKRKPDLARLLLRHELAHTLRSDALFIGVGSPLRWFLKYWLAMAAFFILLPATFIAFGDGLEIVDALQSLRPDHAQIPPEQLNYYSAYLHTVFSDDQINSASKTLASSIRFSLSYNFPRWLQGIYGSIWMLIPENLLVVIGVIVCIWLSEFAADEIAVQTNADRETFSTWLDSARKTHLKSRGAAFLGSLAQALSHPPIRLRNAMMQIDETVAFDYAAIGSIPLIFLLQSACIVARGTLPYFLDLMSAEEVVAQIEAYGRDAMTLQVPIVISYLFARMTSLLSASTSIDWDRRPLMPTFLSLAILSTAYGVFRVLQSSTH